MHGAHHVIEHWGLPGRLLSEYLDALSPRRRLLCREASVSRKPDWRSPRFAEALSRLDRAGFAWEFLRRNPDYRADYKRVVREGQGGAADAAVGERWGLCFCLRSERTCS